MKEKIILAFLVSLLLFSSSASAIVFVNETTTQLVDTKAYCYGNDARDVVSYVFDNFNNSVGYCSGSFFTSPQNCLREFKIDNLDNMKSQLTVEIDPIPINFPCPAPSAPTNNRIIVKLAPDGDDGKAQTQVFDMNECWGWWCGGSTGYNTTICPFDLAWLQPLGLCNQYAVNGWDALKDCPRHRFDVSSDTKWVNVSWDWDSSDQKQIEFEIGFIGLSTSKRVEVVQSNYETLSKETPTHQVLESDIGKMMQMNSSLLTILYDIAEVVILIVVVIMLPAGALLMIKWLWEKVTGRPLGGVRRH